MWRQPLTQPAELLIATATLPAGSHPESRGARVARRRRLHVTDGLRRVARHAAPRARRRRHELLLISRAAAVRPELLELAALVRWSTEADADTIAELHELLTNGCDSPLYNPDVPATDLRHTLHRALNTLKTPRTFSPNPGLQGGTPCR